MRKKTKFKTILFSFLALIFGLILGAGSYVLAFSPSSDELLKLANGDLSIHFLELGNQYAGDAIYIKANDKDILIDAGSRQNSATTITNYINNFCEDGILEYVIATHAHQDHIAAFPSAGSREGIFETYEVKNIIDFGDATKYVRNGATKTAVYNNYVEFRDKEIEKGAKYAKVSDYNELNEDGSPKFLSGIENANPIDKTIDLGSGITLKILDNFYYYNKTTNENDYSVCVLISQGSNNILLTGDLEEKGEEYLVEKNPDLPKCVLFKAAHHGSYTGSTEILLNKIEPQNVVFTCVAGSCEYTKDKQNMFPSQLALDRIAKYTDNCYVTSVCTSTKENDYSMFSSMNGNIVFISNKNETKFNFSNNPIILKNTSWFKENRTWNALAS